MSCADVCLSADHDSSPDFHTEAVVTARKAHRCTECREVIPAGAQYERTSGKWDGRMETLKTCLPCRDVRSAFFCGGFIYGEIWETIRYEMFPVWKRTGSWDCLAKLTTPEAIALCNAEYAEWLGEDDDALPTTGEG